MRFEGFAALVDGDRLGERRLAAFEARDDAFELREGGFEGHGLDVVGSEIGQNQLINAVTCAATPVARPCRS